MCEEKMKRCQKGLSRSGEAVGTCRNCPEGSGARPYFHGGSDRSRAASELTGALQCEVRKSSGCGPEVAQGLGGCSLSQYLLDTCRVPGTRMTVETAESCSGRVCGTEGDSGSPAGGVCEYQAKESAGKK